MNNTLHDKYKVWDISELVLMILWLKKKFLIKMLDKKNMVHNFKKLTYKYKLHYLVYI